MCPPVVGRTNSIISTILRRDYRRYRVNTSCHELFAKKLNVFLKKQNLNVFRLSRVYSDFFTRRPLSCDAGYHESAPGSVSVDCIEGTWTVRGNSSSVDFCAPTCHTTCENGGECTAPNYCDCPFSHFGDFCQFLKCPSNPKDIEHGTFTIE